MTDAKHGIIAAERGGPEALMRVDPKLVKRLSELRLLVDTEPGRREIRLELAARLALIMELGTAEISRVIERGDDVFDTPVLGRYLSFANGLHRMLRDWPDPIEEAQFVEEMDRIHKVLADAEEPSDE